MDLRLYNTLTRKKEVFAPLSQGAVTMYNCGPTVYDFVHIGNLRSFIFADVLRRALEWNGYRIKQVMNITDMGQLVSDADQGEDKMTKGLRREGKPITIEAMRELADFYAERFVEDIASLNIEMPSLMPKASEHIAEDIALIRKLAEKGAAYQTGDGMYFDISKFERYGELAGGVSGEKPGARVEVNIEKRNPADFALWKFNEKLGWDSPWGKGFPGWHIECSAMAMKYLGETIDIHTGGIDLIPIHHTNEIAQSECATGKQFARFWMHAEFVNVEDEKMAKSAGNIVRLNTILERGIHPLAYRYFALTAHYRTLLNFSWNALLSAQTAFWKLHAAFREWEKLEAKENLSLKEKFESIINDDLNTPQAIALLWEIAKDGKIAAEEKKWVFLEFDKILGLGFGDPRTPFREQSGREITDLPRAIQNLLKERESARAHKDFARADTLRDELFQLGYKVADGEDGVRVHKV